MGYVRRLLAGFIAISATAATHAALADVIDGHWCYTDGRRFSIRGPDIVTPAGSATKGSWTRHSFSYQVPPAESDAGQTVYMLLQDEDTVVLAVGTQPVIADPSDVQIWHRCKDQISQLRR